VTWLPARPPALRPAKMKYREYLPDPALPVLQDITVELPGFAVVGTNNARPCYQSALCGAAAIVRPWGILLPVG
jgi:hypothetical protein